MEMFKEESQNSNENQNLESPEKKNLEAFIIAALSKHANKIDEGSRGVILKVDLTKFSDENLAKLGIIINRDRGSVFKILKIENSTLAQHEYQMQKRATQILNTEESISQGLAKVPDISKCIDIDLSHNGGVIKKLSKNGVDVSKNHSVINVIMMDYVPGITLSQYIFKKITEKIIEKDKDSAVVKNEIMKWEGDIKAMLSQSTSKNFCVFLENYFNIDLSSDNFHVIKKNEKLFLNYMERNDVVLNKEIFDVFRKSVVKLNDNRVFNNDLHENNVILNLDEEDELIDLYLIDFGEASDHRDNKMPDDLSIFSSYISFTTTKEQKNKEKLNVYTRNFQNSLERFNSGNKSAIERVSRIKYLITASLNKNNIISIVNDINQELISEHEDYVAIAFGIMLGEGRITREYAMNILDSGLSTPGPSNKWNFVKSILLTNKSL